MDKGSRIRSAIALRNEKMSGAEIARRTRLNPVTVRAYIAGEREPPLDVCNAIGHVLGVHGQWLFDGRGPKFLPEKAEPPEIGVVEVPLIDEVTAGKLGNPSSQIPVQDVPLLAFADLGAGEFFATKVRGTSMDRVSPDGSIIVVNRRDRELIPGRCYIFAHEGQTTYKRWPGGDPPYLEPYSTDAIHKPIFIKRKRDFEVIGRVKRTVLDL